MLLIYIVKSGKNIVGDSGITFTYSGNDPLSSEIWIFRYGQPDRDYHLIIFVAMPLILYIFIISCYANCWRQLRDQSTQRGRAWGPTNSFIPAAFMCLCHDPCITCSSIWSVIVRFVDISGFVEHLDLGFLFKTMRTLPLINTISN